MTTEEKLLSMLNPPEYVSKIKLYCLNCTPQITAYKKEAKDLFVNLE